MTDCLFCKIAMHEVPAKIRYEDKKFIAFDDINPKAPVHILLVPKEHIPSVSALKDENAELMGELVLKARDIAKEIDIQSFRLVFNSGKDAGQSVDHIHLHILGGKVLGGLG